MSELTIAVNGGNRETIAQELRAAVKALAEDTDEDGFINVSIQGLEWQHEEWEFGDPCPECGSKSLHCGEIGYSVYETTETGRMQFRERAADDPTAGFTGVMCNDESCMQQLYRGPESYF